MDRIALSPGDLAKAVGTSESTVRGWMRDQGLPYSRVGGCGLRQVRRFEKWLPEHQESPSETGSEAIMTGWIECLKAWDERADSEDESA